MRKITLSDSEPSPVLSRSETPSHIRKRIWLLNLICLGPLILFGLYLAIKDARVFYESSQSAGWVRTKGQIVESAVQPGSGNRWQVHIRYRYEVDGKPYEADTPRFINRTFNNENTAQTFQNNHPVDQEITVFHHPSQPHKAVLKTGTEWEFLPTIIVGISLSGGALVALFVSVRHTERRYHEKKLREKAAA